jgi:mono/diheme cytochrome c family protein
MARGLKFLVALVVLAIALAGYAVMHLSSSARETPSSSEAWLAYRLRALSIPKGARAEKNPFSSSSELLEEAAHHFADHCASCHGNDGSGDTEMGRHLYPRAPDMRMAATQNLTDGELFYIIHNGVRWTGMPAWGDANADQDSWKLVLLVRHLPKITPLEIKTMEHFNPRSPAEIEEEKKEEDFLNGGSSGATDHKH